MTLVSSPTFEARIDALRRLKNGANPQLLAVWLGQVFQGWSWDSQAQADLDRLASHPWLPRLGLSEATWPSLVLRDDNALRAGLAAGLNVDKIDPALGQKSVRASALVENASPKVHALLDETGIPGLTLAEVVKLLPSVLKKKQVASFDYLMDRHGPTCKMAFEPMDESPLLKWTMNLFVAGHAQLNGKFLGEKFDREFSVHVLVRLEQEGIDCRSSALFGSLDAPRRHRINLLLAEASQARLELRLPPAIDGGNSPPRRPRL